MSIFQTARLTEDLALFTRHLSGAMGARVPLPEILRAYAKDAEEGALRKACLAMSDRVESGVELSEAMNDHGEVFPTAYRRLVRLGEQGKALGGVTSDLAESLEEGLKIYEYFRRAAIYPLLVTILLFFDVCFLGWKIVPKFRDIYEKLGGDYRGIFSADAVSFWLLAGFGLLLLLPILFLMATALGLRVRSGGSGRGILQLPLVGPVLRRAETARFANNLALLLKNHVPVAEALGLLADSSENAYVRAAIQDFHQRYQSGEKLGDLIAAQPLFPASMATMVASAEDQGGLADTLRGLGRHYADRTSHGLAVIREVLEPVLLLLIGLLVGLVLISMYYPLFEIPRMVQ